MSQSEREKSDSYSENVICIIYKYSFLFYNLCRIDVCEST